MQKRTKFAAARMKLAAAAGSFALSLSLSPAASANEIKVVASFSIIGDLARNVGGERIALTTLVGPDGDAHVYESKPADAAAVAAADVVLVNGLHFEGFLGRLVEASGTKAHIVELSEGAAVLSNARDGHHHHHGADDPHAWHSIPNAMVYVANIAKAFCTADAAGCATYRANADAYRKKLDALDQEIRTVFSTIPATRRTVISSHDAFGYFAHEYGLRFLAPQGASTESEASATDVAALIRQVRSAEASAIFAENIGNPHLVEQIARETGLRVGGKLYSDALSKRDGPAGTYEAMMRHNATTIQGAIFGGAPQTAGAAR
jgi:zinc/manganese transport system substrate-binding protein